MWLLYLNHMQSAKSENVQPVLCADTKEDIESFLKQEEARWQDDGWAKTYRKGSVLEWFNPPHDNRYFRDIGTKDVFVGKAAVDAAARYDHFTTGLHKV